MRLVVYRVDGSDHRISLSQSRSYSCFFCFLPNSFLRNPVKQSGHKSIATANRTKIGARIRKRSVKPSLSAEIFIRDGLDLGVRRKDVVSLLRDILRCNLAQLKGNLR